LFEWGEDAVVVALKPLLFCPFESFFQILLVATLAPRDLPLPSPFGDRPKYKRQKAETEKHADGYFEDQDHRQFLPVSPLPAGASLNRALADVVTAHAFGKRRTFRTSSASARPEGTRGDYGKITPLQSEASSKACAGGFDETWL
jgi:hypothetical protein